MLCNRPPNSFEQTGHFVSGICLQNKKDARRKQIAPRIFYFFAAEAVSR